MAVINALGRRKTAVARVYLTPGTGQVTVNGKDQNEYFAGLYHVSKVTKPLTVLGLADKFNLNVNVKGGGVKGQVEATRAGFSKGKPFKKVGMKAQDTCELFFDNVQIPKENLLGEVGKGFVYMMQKLGRERLSVALMAVGGACVRACVRACMYVCR